MKKKVVLYSIAILIACPLFFKTFRVLTVQGSPDKIDTKHFTINYQGIYKSDALKVGQKLENVYLRIRTELNDPDHGRIVVFIHGSQDQFNQATGLQGNSNGTSRGPYEFHILWTNWLNSIFPDNPLQTAVHEFTHCIQLNILIKIAKQSITTTNRKEFDSQFDKRFTSIYPRWLWESISIYEAGEKNVWSIKYAKSKNLNLSDLNNSNQIYNIGYTIPEYIVSRWGKDALPVLVKNFGNVEEALFVSNQNFERGWKDFLTYNY